MSSAEPSPVIRNPILPGFNADPSILRVEDDFYLATSTFEWFPGVAIYHSMDLVHWRLLTHALTRTSQLDMAGNPGSCGVWAPNLTWDPEARLFYLLYTDVKGLSDSFFDLHNYLVTAPAIDGPWSDPVYLNASGFDPSLFHDDTGRKWVANLEWDFRKGYEHPGAIVLQEYSVSEKRLVGEARRIYRGGTDYGCLEGASLFRHGDFYYLMTAEGGTGYGHAVVLARSHFLEGPYESDPENPVLTALAAPFYGRGQKDFLKPELYNPRAVLQKCGHGSPVETRTGEWFLAHLCARPLMPALRCTLNRETALQRLGWTVDGWLRLEGGGRHPSLEVEPPALPSHPWPERPSRDDFDSPRPDNRWYSLRVPTDPSWISLTERPGHLRLYGRESPRSAFRQSLLGRRVEHFSWDAETVLEFSPKRFQQMAGLLLKLGLQSYFYLRVYWSETFRCRCIGIMTSVNGVHDELLQHRVPVPFVSPVHLRMHVERDRLRCYWSAEGRSWTQVGPVLDATLISDEASSGENFSGSFICLTASDLSGERLSADFDYFEYRGIP